ncbi:MAG: phosphatidylglycerophosphatase A, partial [Veillonella parvula]
MLLAVPHVSLFWGTTAFVTFRLFDILKPYPIRYFDEKLTNGSALWWMIFWRQVIAFSS